jgi:hypothetical protein
MMPPSSCSPDSDQAALYLGHFFQCAHRGHDSLLAMWHERYVREVHCIQDLFRHLLVVTLIPAVSASRSNIDCAGDGRGVGQSRSSHP